MRILFVLILITLASCGSNHLTVYTDYINYENLASFHVGTPDPSLDHPPFGQRLIVSWSLPKGYSPENAFINMIVRYRNRDQEDKTIPLKRVKGTFFHCLLNNDFCEKGGILTYHIQLYWGECLIEERRHLLWEDLIIFKDPTDCEGLNSEEDSDPIEFLP